MVVKFCYWPVKFRAEYLRWIMAYLNLDYEEVYPESFNEWGIMKSKFSSKNPLINLPYFYDPTSKVVVSECVAISYALALKYGGLHLLGNDNAQILMQRSLQESVKTIREVAFKCFNHTMAELKELYEGVVKSRVLPKIHYMDHCKDPSHKFMLGPEDVTLVDFEIAHVIMLFDYVAQETGLKNPFSDCENLY